jgi:hypothetical protein
MKVVQEFFTESVESTSLEHGIRPPGMSLKTMFEKYRVDHKDDHVYCLMMLASLSGKFSKEGTSKHNTSTVYRECLRKFQCYFRDVYSFFIIQPCSAGDVVIIKKVEDRVAKMPTEFPALGAR